jgi:hypothetical protein
MADKEKKETQPGAVDDDAMARVRARKAAQKKALEDAWNTGRNTADPSRTRRGRVDNN